MCINSLSSKELPRNLVIHTEGSGSIIKLNAVTISYATLVIILNLEICNLLIKIVQPNENINYGKLKNMVMLMESKI
jgi:hypothetical protein